MLRKYFITFTFIIYQAFGCEDAPSKGSLIVGMGISGCGKTSIMKELSTLANLPVFYEPEEKDWGQAVTHRESCGNFTMLSWFRSERVPKLFQASSLRDQGKIVLMDSYYDKLFYQYVGKSGMEWIMPPNDPYYQIAVNMMEKDWQLLPNANYILFLSVEFEDWKYFLSKRNRNLDKDEGFLESFKTQDLFLEAVREAERKFDSKVIIYNQKPVSARENAQEIFNLLLKENVLTLPQ